MKLSVVPSSLLAIFFDLIGIKENHSPIYTISSVNLTENIVLTPARGFDVGQDANLHLCLNTY